MFQASRCPPAVLLQIGNYSASIDVCSCSQFGWTNVFSQPFCFALASDLIVGATVFAVYLPTLAPGISGGDSGELVAESCHLGTAHPPGYPLFTIVNHIATQILPWLLDSIFMLRPGAGVDGRASPAWCANATAGLLGTLAAMFATNTAALLCDRWGRTSNRGKGSRPCSQHFDDVQFDSAQCGGCLDGGYRYRSDWDSYDGRVCRALASSCAGMLMAFSPLAWQYSVTAEVFALNNFLLSLLCYLTVLFASSGRDFFYAASGAFVSGLALSNQHTAVLYVVPLAAWVMMELLTSRCRLHNTQEQPWPHLAQQTLTLVGLFALGLTPCCYLPLAALVAPRPGSWGNVVTWRGFLHHLLRRDYGSLRLYAGGASRGVQGFEERLHRWAENLSSVQGLAGIVPALAVVGAASAVMCACLGASASSAQTTKQNNSESGYREQTNGLSEEERFKGGYSFWSSLSAPISGSKTGINTNRNKTSTKPPTSAILRSKDCRKYTEQQVADYDAEKRPLAKSLTKEQRPTPRITWTTPHNVTDVLAFWDDEGSSAPIALLLALMLYLVVFNWLSNMPLDDPLLFGVHARFWMQPNNLVFVFCGVGLYRAFGMVRFVETKKYVAIVVHVFPSN